jgi:hypothetical protein
MRRLTIPVLLVVALAGCGGNDEKRVRATIAAESRALAAEQWNAVCALRTAAGRREFLRTSLRPDAKTCAEAWTPAPEANEPILTVKLSPSKRRLTDVDVDGDVARARYSDGSVVRLRKVDGRWLVDA